MKNDIKIFEYLSDLMDEENKKKFEEEIKNSYSLSNKVNQYAQQLVEFSNFKDVEIDERYFSNLIPQMHKKLDHRKKNINKSIYYAIPIAAAVIVAIISFPFKNADTSFQLNSLTDFVVNNIENEDVADVLLSDYSLENSIFYNAEKSSNFNTGLPEVIEVSNGEFYNMIDISLLDYNKSEFISDNELQNIYNKIK
jgi:hypothetical protein